MRVDLLGTGAADGWPNAFCRCASCSATRSAGELRAPTSALVDRRLLLDCGPETPRQALRQGHDLSAVTHVLLTHAHPDHSAPMALLSRSWAGRREPLVVAGPAEAVEAWRHWAAPEDPVTFTTLAPGDELDADGLSVLAVPARHGAPGSAVLYDVRAASGERLLYAADTGPLTEETLDACRDAAYDLVLLEETFGARTDHGTDHLDQATFPRAVAALKEVGAVTAATDVVAVHLGHHNPPGHRLTDLLSAWGARAVPDGTTLVAGTGRPDHLRHKPSRTLVTGGARSGKSRAAESLLAAEPEVLYVAAGPATGSGDPEWDARVAEHRTRRAHGWRTVETAGGATGLADALRSARVPVLVDCLATWLTDVLDRAGTWEDRLGWHAAVEAEVDDLLEAWASVHVTVVAVTNEVGSGVVPASASGRLFQDLLGRLNQRVAAASERVLLTVAGRTLDLSGTRPLTPEDPRPVEAHP